jgi:hypothetical protein
MTSWRGDAGWLKKGETEMAERKGIMEVVGVAIIIIALSAAGLAANFLTGIAFNIDGLLLVSVCLLMALVFAAMLLSLAKQLGLIGKRKSSDASSAGQAPTA